MAEHGRQLGILFLDDTVAKAHMKHLQGRYLPAGPAAERPTVGKRKGEVYFSLDTSTLSIWSGTAWVEQALPVSSSPTGGLVSVIASGLAAAKPASANPGGLYAASDTDEMFIYFDGSTTGPGILSVVAHGPIASRPAVPDDLGSVYVATDEGKPYIYI